LRLGGRCAPQKMRRGGGGNVVSKQSTGQFQKGLGGKEESREIVGWSGPPVKGKKKTNQRGRHSGGTIRGGRPKFERLKGRERKRKGSTSKINTPKSGSIWDHKKRFADSAT